MLSENNLTNSAEETLLFYLFKNTAQATFVGLAITAITNEDTLATIDEVGDGGYVRKSITFSDPLIMTAGGTMVENTAQVTFGPWSANQTAEITFMFVCSVESGTAGKLISWYELDDPFKKQPLAGETVVLPAGALIQRID